LLALPLLALAWLLWWLDPNSLRPLIEQQARERLGVVLQLSGPLRWSLWPALSVQSGPGALGTDPAVPLLRWQGLQFTLRWPGWRVTPWQFDGLVIDGLQVQLQADETGRWNLAGLRDALSAALRDGVSAQRALRIHPLRLRNADIAVRTAPDANWWRATQLDVKASLDGSADALQWTLANLQISGQLGGGVLPEAGQAVSVSGAQWVIELPAAAGQGVDRGGRLRISPLQMRLGSASLRVTADSSLQWQPLRGAGELQFETASLRDWLAAQGTTLPPARDAKVLRAVSLAARWKLTDTEVALDDLRLRLDDTQLQGRVGGRWREPQDWQVELKGDAVNLDRYRRPDADPGEPFRLPVAALRTLPLNGSVRLQRLTAGGAVARDALIELHSAQAAGRVRRP